MSRSTTHTVVKKLRKRYLLALTIIGCIVIGSQILIQFAIQGNIDDSRIINLAGRQRMLSQKISKIVLEIDRSRDEMLVQTQLGELDKAIALWKKTNEGLLKGDVSLDLPGNNSDRIINMFEGNSVYYEAVLKAANAFSQISKSQVFDREAREKEVEIILQNEPLFLKGMDDIVFQYDFEAKDKVNHISKTEWILMIMAIATLLVEVRFIFMPAEKHIQGALSDLLDSEDNVRKLFDIAPSAMLLIDATDYTIIRLNVMACEVIGVPFNKAIERRFYDFVSGEYLDALKIANEERFYGEVSQIEAMLRNENGESLIMLMSVTRMTYHNQAIFLVGLADITDRKKHENVLRELATTDEMTNLLNRRMGLLMLSKEIEKAHREIYDLTVCFIDLDGLKKVNDHYGHSEGDWFIKQVAEVLLNNVRLGDVVFRYGGDEMILVLSNCTEEEAEIIMMRINLDLQRINKRKEKPFELALSYGIADYNKHKPDNLDLFLAMADEKMGASLYRVGSPEKGYI